MNYRLSIGLLALMLAAAAAQAHDHDHDHDHHHHDHEQHREHGAHVHGLAQMNVAFADGVLEIELIAPGANIVGFEHAPRGAEQRQAIERALTQLRRGERLFAPTAAAGCRLTGAEAATSAMQSEHHGHDHGHNHEHEHQGGDDGHRHSEFTASYRFECANPGRLQRMNVQLFEHFPGNETIEAQVLTATGQGLQRLTPRRAELRF